MLDEQTQKFFTLLFDSLKSEIGRLAEVIEAQAATIRRVEISTTTRIAELQKDVDGIRARQEVLSHQVQDKENLVEREEGLRQAADITIENKWNTSLEKLRAEFETYVSADAERWIAQRELNTSIKTISRLLWAIFIVVIGLVITLLWNIFLSGGIANLKI